MTQSQLMRTFDRLPAVFGSCRTKAQLLIARRYAQLFLDEVSARCETRLSIRLHLDTTHLATDAAFRIFAPGGGG